MSVVCSQLLYRDLWALGVGWRVLKTGTEVPSVRGGRAEPRKGKRGKDSESFTNLGDIEVVSAICWHIIGLIS